MNVESLSLSPPVVAGVLVVLPILYQLNARITPWESFSDRVDGRYLQFWGANTVLHWGTAAVVVGLLLQSGSGIKAIGLSLPAKGKIIGLVVIYSLFLGIYYWGVIANGPIDEGLMGQYQDGWTPATPRQQLISIFTLSVTPGICEEIVYRGFAITALLSFGYSPVVATAVSTIPFILLHGKAAFSSVGLFGKYAVLGIVFAAIYLQTGSLWPGIVAHASYNLMATVQAVRHYPYD